MGFKAINSNISLKKTKNNKNTISLNWLLQNKTFKLKKTTVMGLLNGSCNKTTEITIK